MPMYEYRCKSCGHELEVQQSFSDAALEVCPECEGPLRKVYGNVGIAFKGSGFYKNDARSGSKKSSAAASSSSTSGDSSSSSSSSDGGSSSGAKSEKAASSTSSSTSSD